MQDQSILLLALNGIFGSQTSFMYNRIQSVWQDSAHGTVRIAMLTYTNQIVQSIDDVSPLGPFVFHRSSSASAVC